MHFANIADWALERTGAAWNDEHQKDLKIQGKTVFILTQQKKKALSDIFDKLRANLREELKQLSETPRAAEMLLNLYKNEPFDSDRHRLTYLEACLKFLAGGVSSAEDEPFPWPSTFVPNLGFQRTSEFEGQFELRGMLSNLGYHVGKLGLTAIDRKKLLGEIFLKPNLPHINSPAYTQEWGKPDTSTRLRKMADSIAAFCRNAKRRNGSDMTESINSWEIDLAWLKVSFYDGRFGFPWPKNKD